jgi:cytochrome oxidase Cu insertion factor (SCO1/SenC/PrrC family)
MKNLIQTLSVLTVVAFLFTSCGGGGGKTVKNDFLGEYPSIVKNYQQKIADLEKDAKTNTDMNKAFEIAKKIENTKDEFKTKLEEYAKNTKLDKNIPFQPLSGTKYTVNSIKVERINDGGLGLAFTTTINDDIKDEYNTYERTLFIYIQALSADGQVIPGSTTAAMSTPMADLKKGLQTKMICSWGSGKTQNFENFASIKEITRAEYDQNK